MIYMKDYDKKKLNQIINYYDKLNQKKSFHNYDYLIEALRKCVLRIDTYPNYNGRASNKIPVTYTIKTNDETAYNTLNDDIRDIAKVFNELIDDSYELPYDDDGDPYIEIKYVDEELSYIPSEPKITFEKCVEVVKNNILKAQTCIIGAVAWITNKEILDLLIEKSKEGVIIYLISDNNTININFRNDNKQYTDLPFPICYVTNFNQNYYGNNAKMHEKFCIIDMKIVLYGTFNWTQMALLNDEAIHEDFNNSSVKSYLDEFKRLYTKYGIGITYPIFQF